MMRNSQVGYNCIYNLLHVKFNEDFGRDGKFSYDLQYPSFYAFKNTYFKINPSILSQLNSTIKANVNDFKEGTLKEEEEMDRKFNIMSCYAVTFNKNYVLSSILTLKGFVENEGLLYNQLNNFNIDLNNGKTIYLRDIFKENVDYITLITNYVNYKINQNRDLYYENYDLYIPEDQAFYITDDGIVIYFELDEIAPKDIGVPKFKMSFEKFAPYINPRFFCSPQNINTLNSRHFRYYLRKNM